MSLPSLIATVVVVMVASAAATIMAASWVIPSFLTDDTAVYIRNQGTQENPGTEQMDTLFAKQMEQRLIPVYDKRKAMGGTLYGEAAKTGMLALLSSDGWGVMYDPAYTTGAEQFWQVVDAQGAVIHIEKTVCDKVSDLVFVKLQGNGFQVFSFLDWRDVDAGVSVWVGGVTPWKKTALDFSRIMTKEIPVAPHVSFYDYVVTNPPRHSDVIVSEQGQLVGFVDELGNVVPGFITVSHLPFVLTEGVLQQKQVPILGQFVSYQITEKDMTPVAGFYISSLTSPAIKKVLQVGDVMVKINGQAVTKNVLAPLLLTSSDDVLVDVWRKGIIIPDLLVKKEIAV